MSKIKVFILITLITGLASGTSAQKMAKPGSFQFHSINSVGLLEGETGSAFQLQTINGAQWKSWFAGVGAGLDYYKFRSIPLFMDFRKEFGKNGNKIFLYSDFGLHFTWLTDQQKSGGDMNGKFNNGFYTDLGFGYKIAMKKNNALQLSLGYSLKKSSELTSPVYFPYIDFTGSGSYPSDKINYTLNRLSIKMGWEF